MTTFPDILDCERLCYRRLINLPLGAERDAARERHAEAASILVLVWHAASVEMPPLSWIGRLVEVDGISHHEVDFEAIEIADLEAGIPA